MYDGTIRYSENEVDSIGHTVFLPYNNSQFDMHDGLLLGRVRIGSNSTTTGGVMNLFDGIVDSGSFVPGRDDMNATGTGLASGVRNNQGSIELGSIIHNNNVTGTILEEGRGTFNMYNGTLTGDRNRGISAGGRNVNIRLTGGNIEGNAANLGAGVRIRFFANMLMEAPDPANPPQIMNNIATTDYIANPNYSGSGGGVGLSYGARFEMRGGYIRENRSEYFNGGGVSLFSSIGQGNNGASFIMSGGSIFNNTALVHGGGVNVTGNNASVILSGDASIRNNTSLIGDGGGIRSTSNSMIIITENASIYNNFTLADSAAAEIAYNTFRANSDILHSRISQPGVMNPNLAANVANVENTGNGGGISLAGTATLDMESGMIDNNTATRNGGGVALEATALFFAESGSITNNEAGEDGGGVWTGNLAYDSLLEEGDYGNLDILESVIFSGNSAGQGSSKPPSNWEISAIRGTGTSPTIEEHQSHQINNYDVNFRFIEPEARVNRDDVEIIVGQSEQMRSVVDVFTAFSPFNGTIINATTTWESTDERIATVNHRGVVRTHRLGRAYIISRTTIRGRVIETRSRVTVIPVRVRSINIGVVMPNIQMNVGDSRALDLFMTPSNATNRDRVWWTDHPDVARVDGSGRLVARGGGTTHVRVRSVCGGHVSSRRVTVNATLSVDRSTWSPTMLASTTTFRVTSNTTWTATSMNPSWLTVNRGSSVTRTGNVSFNASVTPNPRTLRTRTGTIRITAQGATTRMITVRQAQANSLALSPSSSWSPSASASNRNVNVFSNVRWTARSSHSNWLRINGSGSASGNRDGAIRITTTRNLSRNPRSGTITVTAPGAATRIISVTQEGVPFVSLSRSSWNPSAPANDTTVRVSSNRLWSATSNQSWLRVNQGSLINRYRNGNLEIRVTRNTRHESRTGTIRVTAPGAATQIITVRQNRAVLTLDGAGIRRNTATGNSMWDPPSAASSTTVNVRTNSDWNVSTRSTGNWLSVDRVPIRARRNGSGSFRIRAARNTTRYSRIGTVTVTATGAPTRVIHVTQQQMNVLTLPGNSTRTIPARASTVSVTIDSNTAWTATTNQSWLTINNNTSRRLDGRGTRSITLHATRNRTTGSREARLRVVSAASDVPNREILVRQTRATLTVNGNSLSRNPISGHSTWQSGPTESFTTANVTSNSLWTVSSSVGGSNPWLRVSNIAPSNRIENGSFRINVTRNTGAAPRAGTITVSVDGAGSRIITVTQQGSPSLSISPSGNWNINYQSTNRREVTVTTTASSWLVSTPSWIDMSRTANNRFVITPRENTGSDERRGTVTVTAGGVVRTITVIQQPRPSLSLSPSGSWRIDATATNSREITVTTTAASWSLDAPSWLNVSRTTNNRFVINPRENTGSDERSGTVTVTAAGLTRTITVIQQAPRPIDTTREEERASCTGMSVNVLALIDNRAFNQATWDNATPDGREDILRDFFAEVNRVLGHTPRQALSFRDLGAGPSGTYNPNTGQITINTRYLQDATEADMRRNREEAMLTVIHEARHEFQHNAVRNHNQFRVSLETRNHWQNNIDNYITPGSAAHFAQPIEWDAWNFEDSAYRIRPVIQDAGLRPEYEGSWPW